LERGHVPVPYKIIDGLNAGDAYLMERFAVGIMFGRLDIGAGSLLNTMEGGYGPRRCTTSTRTR
jgi:hypothetical protein